MWTYTFTLEQHQLGRLAGSDLYGDRRSAGRGLGDPVLLPAGDTEVNKTRTVLSTDPNPLVNDRDAELLAAGGFHQRAGITLQPATRWSCSQPGFGITKDRRRTVQGGR